MRIWRSLNCSVFVFCFIVVNDIKRCMSSTENDLDLTFDVANFDSDLLNRHLQRLQESLRWIRSPRPKSVFRPWGGKRSVNKFPRIINVPLSNEALCSSIPSNDEEKWDLLCPTLLTDKRDKFRAWGGKRFQEFPRSEEQKEDFEGLRNSWNKATNLSGTSTMLSDLMKALPYYSRVQYMTEGIPYKQGLFSKQTVQGDKVLKRQKFYPWGGKRSPAKRDKFYPWGGKRSINVKREKFNPWGGKRSRDKREKFNPWGGKRSTQELVNYESNMNDSDMQNNSKEDPQIPLMYVNDELDRKRRSTTEYAAKFPPVKIKMSGNLAAKGAAATTSVPSSKPNIHFIHKRSTISSESSDLKKINILSNLLKKFESVKDRSAPSQRFSPWAGKKRAEVATGTSMGKTIEKRDAVDANERNAKPTRQ